MKLKKLLFVYSKLISRINGGDNMLATLARIAVTTAVVRTTQNIVKKL